MPFKRELLLHWPDIVLTVSDKLGGGEKSGHGWRYELVNNQPITLSLRAPSTRLRGEFTLFDAERSFLKLGEKCDLNEIGKLFIKLHKEASLRTDKMRVESKPLAEMGAIKKIMQDYGPKALSALSDEQFDLPFSTNFDAKKFDRLLRWIDNAGEFDDKGRSYETLAEDLLSRCQDVFEVIRTNFDDRGNKVDLLVRVLNQPFFGDAGSNLVVECKNRKVSTGVETERQIDSYMRDYWAKWGIIFAINRETSYTHEKRYRLYNSANCIIVVITREDLDEIREKRNFLSMLRRKRDDLVTNASDDG